MAELLISVLRPIAFWLSRILYRVEFEGAHNVPAEGPVILTPNHVSYPDPIWVSIPVERRIYYMAWDALFRIPLLANLCRTLGAFPVRLEGYDKRAMREAHEHLAAGRALMIFPEGGRSVSGKLLVFKPGAFRIALATGAQIVPITLDGAYEIWPAGRLLPQLRGHLKIIYHEPIPVERADEVDCAEFKRRSRELANRARAAVASSLDESKLSDPFPDPPEHLAPAPR